MHFEKAHPFWCRGRSNKKIPVIGMYREYETFIKGFHRDARKVFVHITHTYKLNGLGFDYVLVIGSLTSQYKDLLDYIITLEEPESVEGK